MRLKSGPSHRMLGLHGSPQCLFFRWSGTYEGVGIFGSGALAMGSYASEGEGSLSSRTVSTWDVGGSTKTIRGVLTSFLPSMPFSMGDVWICVG